MPLYLVTSNAIGRGGIHLFDSECGELQQLLRGSFRGITRGPDDAWYVVSGNRNPQKDVSVIHRLDPHTWRSEPIAQLPVKDSHDLRWFDGAFYLVASVGNQILKLDAGCRLVETFRLAESEDDTCHVNCLAWIDGTLHCTVFTLTPGDREEKRGTGIWHTDGKLLRLDFAGRSSTVVHEALWQPHSLVPRPDGLYLVESHRSTITRIDLDDGSSQVMRQYSGFLRGLAFSADEVVLGVCVMYARDRHRLRPLPWFRQWGERLRPFAGLLVLDERLRVRRRVPMPLAEVYDIVAVDEPSPAAPQPLTPSAGD